MAHFYADVKGGRKEKTATGTATSGITAHVRGWTIGMRVECSHETVGTGKNKKDVDVCRVYPTGGSNNPSSGRLLAEVKSK